MSEDDSAPLTTRLLAVTLATHEAFTLAARAVVAPGYAAEFARRAEYQERIATHLRGHCAAEGLSSDALRRIPEVARPRTPEPGDGDPKALYDECLRVMDAGTMEFCRGYGPDVARVLSDAMRVAYPINTTIQGGIKS